MKLIAKRSVHISPARRLKLIHGNICVYLCYLWLNLRKRRRVGLNAYSIAASSTWSSLAASDACFLGAAISSSSGMHRMVRVSIRRKLST